MSFTVLESILRPLAYWYEQDGIEHVISDADTLIFATGYHVDPTVEEVLKECGCVYHLIGDGHKPGNIKDAISEAWLVTKEL